jgi:hypothetical protein
MAATSATTSRKQCDGHKIDASRNSELPTGREYLLLEFGCR